MRALQLTMTFALLLVAGHGRAEPRTPAPRIWPAPGASVLAPPQAPPPAAADDDTTAQDAEADARAQPLRLSLLDPAGLTELPTASTCQGSAEPDSRLQRLIQHSAANLALGRHITLHGLSRWDCPRTTAISGAATAAATLSPELQAVLGAGVAGFPHALDGGWLLRGVLRADLQWKTRDGARRNAGVELLQSAVKAGTRRRVGASIGGTF